MSMSTVLIISIAAGVILVVGGGLVMYMASLVKNAYELKVQINSDIDERLGKMGEDLDKKSRWIKRDLLEEIEKIKSNLEADNARRFNELADPVRKRVDDIELILRKEHDEWVKAIETDREAITKLEAKLSTVRRPQAESPAAAAAAVAAADTKPAASADDMTAVMAATAPSPIAAAAAPKVPSAVDPKSMNGFLPEFGKKR
ncbi:conserved hypothetical protein [Candidatus Terasakiella magnetica]|nr:conserved hypothetical protein [Candidatus Terasakiella magnetica]